MENEKIYFHCPKCGGHVVIENGQSMGTCADCDSLIPLPNFLKGEMGDIDINRIENIILRLNKASYFQNIYQFHRAFNLYDKIIKVNIACNNDDFYPYWGKVLAQYGVIYKFNDLLENEIVCLRINNESIFNNENYQKAIELADLNVQVVLKQEATRIENLARKSYLEIVNYKPIDVVICVDDSENNQFYEKDWQIAQDLIKELDKNNLTYFVTTEMFKHKDLGNWQKRAFPALETGDMMVVISSSYEHVNSSLFRNVWMPFYREIPLKATINYRLIMVTDMDEYHNDPNPPIENDLLCNQKDDNLISTVIEKIKYNWNYIQKSDAELIKNEVHYPELEALLDQGRFNEVKDYLREETKKGDLPYGLWWISYLTKKKCANDVELIDKIIDPREDYYYQQAYLGAPRCIKRKYYEFLEAYLEEFSKIDEVDEKFEASVKNYQNEVYKRHTMLLSLYFMISILYTVLAYFTLSLGNGVSFVLTIIGYAIIFGLIIYEFIKILNLGKLPVGLRTDTDVKKYFYKIRQLIHPLKAAQLMPCAMYKKLRIIAIVLITITSAFSLSFMIKESIVKIANRDLEYYYLFKKVYITGGSAEKLIIPSTINNRKVYKINDGAFSNNTKILEINMYNGLSELGGHCFSNCENLQTVVLPTSLAKVNRDDPAFVGCSNISQFIISKKTSSSENGGYNIKPSDLLGNDWKTTMPLLDKISISGE